MAAKGGRKYRLLLYERMVNHFLPAIFTLGFVILLNVGVLWGAEWYFGESDPLLRLSTEGGSVMLFIGGLILLFWVFMLLVRKNAYVQLFPEYLRMATPFLRMNISYKRIHHTTPAQMGDLFPPKRLTEWGRDIIGPLASRSAIVIHLKSYPISRKILQMFLSQYFFYDKSPHIILAVDDWMRFSVELESRRSGVKVPTTAPRPTSSYGLLDELKKK